MKRTKLAASFLLVATLFLTGCVTKKEFVNLQTDYNKLKDEKSALDKSYQDAQIQLAESFASPGNFSMCPTPPLSLTGTVNYWAHALHPTVNGVFRPGPLLRRK